MNFTPLARPYFALRRRAILEWTASRQGIERAQMRELRSLLQQARDTEAGRRYGFAEILLSPDPARAFAAAVPVAGYEDVRPDIMRMVMGERDILWPGRTLRFAQSSGTSGGKSKYIPITDAALHRNHYAGASDAVAFYLGMNPHSRLFGGRSFILGGSYANEVANLPPDVRVGDLSATLIAEINPLVNLFRVPDRRTALMADWDKKLPALVEASLHADITNISGVPSWFMTVIEKVIERAGANTIHDVWPNLEVFFHGGISFAPYREQYRRLTDPRRMHYVENYNASEGFFAAQDTPDAEAGMLLLLDRGIYYEFRPLDGGEAVGAGEVEQGRTYELLVSSCNGLWRYSPGDTVRIESAVPLRISVAGRTKSYINAFGEELMVHNAEAAMAAACRTHGCEVADYTAAPVYARADGSRGRHQWLVEWRREPASVTAFAETLDRELQRVNSDYAAKRAGGIFLDGPEVRTARPGLFETWLAQTGKLGGQRKVPRLSNSRELMDRLLEMNNSISDIQK
ncbi:MAG: GH3 auxin-responsive promoter family protein [Muribaculaceae bacterium]|nr:GH3 auxin-responsive promoter family protein [Muribaculaceae bacterium]